MHTVFLQELARYNRLVDTVRSSLRSLVNAQKGLVVMSAELDRMADSLHEGRVPSCGRASRIRL